MEGRRGVVGQLGCKVIRGKGVKSYIVGWTVLLMPQVNAPGQCMDTWTLQFIDWVSPGEIHQIYGNHKGRDVNMRCSSELQSLGALEITDQKTIKNNQKYMCKICVCMHEF